MRICRKCKTTEFVGKNQLCRDCNNEYMREYRARNKKKIIKYNKEYDEQYYNQNKEEILKNKKTYYQEHKEEKLKKQKAYYQQHKGQRQAYNKQYYKDNREKLLTDAKQYAKINKVQVNEYHNQYNKDRRINDINFRIKTAVSANINFYLKLFNSSKDGKSCLKYLPYTIGELRKHLENQFEWWMSWDNYGKYDAGTWNDNSSDTWTWQIDHIVPQSLFNYTSMEDSKFLNCWALSNLRPLSAKQNFLDGVNRSRHK